MEPDGTPRCSATSPGRRPSAPPLRGVRQPHRPTASASRRSPPPAGSTRSTRRGRYPGCRQQPRLPFAVAATGPRGMRVAARHGATWVTTGPRDRRASTDEGVAADPRSDRAARAGVRREGRDPRRSIGWCSPASPSTAACSRPDAFADTAERYAEAGVTDLVVHWPRDTALRRRHRGVRARSSADGIRAMLSSVRGHSVRVSAEGGHVDTVSRGSSPWSPAAAPAWAASWWCSSPPRAARSPRATCTLDAWPTPSRRAEKARAGGHPRHRRTRATWPTKATCTRFRDEVLAEHDTDHVNLVFNNAGIGGGGSFVTGDREPSGTAPSASAGAASTTAAAPSCRCSSRATRATSSTPAASTGSGRRSARASPHRLQRGEVRGEGLLRGAARGLPRQRAAREGRGRDAGPHRHRHRASTAARSTAATERRTVPADELAAVRGRVALGHRTPTSSATTTCAA